MDAVKEMPPYGIKEPIETYSDGRPRDNGAYFLLPSPNAHLLSLLIKDCLPVLMLAQLEIIYRE